jgi:hypothetical protein
MAKPLSPDPCLFFCGIIYKDENLALEILQSHMETWGSILDVTPPLPFTWTSYYKAENSPVSSH